MKVVIVFFELLHINYMVIKFHLNIRDLGVQYLREHPERFIESNSENSWFEYLTSNVYDMIISLFKPSQTNLILEFILQNLIHFL